MLKIFWPIKPPPFPFYFNFRLKYSYSFQYIAAHIYNGVTHLFTYYRSDFSFEYWSFEMVVLLSGLLPNPKLETSVLSVRSVLQISSSLFSLLLRTSKDQQTIFTQFLWNSLQSQYLLDGVHGFSWTWWCYKVIQCWKKWHRLFLSIWTLTECFYQHKSFKWIGGWSSTRSTISFTCCCNNCHLSRIDNRYHHNFGSFCMGEAIQQRRRSDQICCQDFASACFIWFLGWLPCVLDSSVSSSKNNKKLHARILYSFCIFFSGAARRMWMAKTLCIYQSWGLLCCGITFSYSPCICFTYWRHGTSLLLF